MANLPADLAARLRAAGLTVVEIDGWRTRGRPGSFGPVGVLNHHTGASAKQWSVARRRTYAVWMFLTGRSDLPAPLCHGSIGPDGTFYLGAAGRANHAGKAKKSGSVAAGDGNRIYIGLEWMLSGTESISKAQYDAGVTANAVLTHMLGNSVETISCHYNTSVTGKWDIGDPNGVPFKGHKVLDVPKFRRAVQARRNELYNAPRPIPSPPKPSLRVHAGHVSLRYSLTTAQKEADALKIFSIGFDWITGTEALEKNGYNALRKAAAKYGYWIHRPSGQDCWVAVKGSIVDGRVHGWYSGTVVPGKKGKHSNLGVPAVRFKHKNPGVGWIGVASAHYTTRKQDPKRVGARRIASKISSLSRSWGKGPWLFFSGIDGNQSDKTTDQYFGGPMITCWDEVGRYPDTGHGNIDSVARSKGDLRVKCVSANVIGDTLIPLSSDHKIVSTYYEIVLET